MENTLKMYNELIACIIDKKENSKVKSMIDDIEMPDSAGRTLLHYAVTNDNCLIAAYIIEKGWDPNEKNDDGDTPLQLAMLRRSFLTTRMLIEKNAEMGSCMAKRGNVLLSFMNSEFNVYIDITRLILKAMTRNCISNVEKADKLLNAKCPFPAVVILEDPVLTKLMLRNGCDVNAIVPGTYETALHLSVRLGDFENVEFLSNYDGVNVNAKNADGYTPLSLFSMKADDPDQKLVIVEMLADHKESLSTEIRPRHSVARELLRFADYRTVKKLLMYLDLFHRNSYGDMLFHDIAWNKNCKFFDLVGNMPYDIDVQDGKGRTLLGIAACTNDVDGVKTLLKLGADVNVLDPEDKTVLEQTLTLEKPSRAIIELLLQYGGDVRTIFSDKAWINFLSQCDLDIVKPLLAHMVLIISLGVSVPQKILTDILAIESFQKQFLSYQGQIARMKKVVVYEEVTLYDLIKIERDDAKNLIRNADFVSKYYVCMHQEKAEYSIFYRRSIKLRIGELIELQLKK